MVTLRDVMSIDVETVTPTTTLKEAAILFSELHISGAPVVSAGRVVGVVSAFDLLSFEAERVYGDPPERVAIIETDPEPAAEEVPIEPLGPAPAYFSRVEEAVPETVAGWWRSGRVGWDDLDEHAVTEVMTRDLVSLPPETPVQAAARSMLKAGVHRVLVMDGPALRGVVTTTDIIKAVAQYGLNG